MKRPRLANTLEIIANQGADAFYTGVLADKIVKEVRDRGGIFTTEDLATYTVDVRDALSVDLNGTYTAYTTHAPTSGPILTFILNILQGNKRIEFETIMSAFVIKVTIYMKGASTDRHPLHYFITVLSRHSNLLMPREVNWVTH